ncbi:MAG: N-acetylglucosamine-6-phosphate deacetylase [Chloroflexi bacterium]|jgi:N-acetylglucosamine-6-phosphate deacetylase|nr:N-acetylglucosamine-6-phosphate deacetylase [Chloroflexota bacterium]
MNELSKRFALVNGRIALPEAVEQGKALIVDGPKIAGIIDSGALADEINQVDVGGRLIAPGLIDIHTHGALGHTFNEPTAAAFEVITRENARRGVTSLLATPATAPISNLVDCLEFSRQWMGEDQLGAQVLGVHLEGPYFSLPQAGAQDPANIRNPNDGTAGQLLDHHDVIRMVSYAPELPGALELTARLAALGIVPAAGHSSAKEDEVVAAIEMGLRHIIHIWSAQSTTVREGPWRKPGLLEVSLASDELTVEMICDNKHLPPTLMKLAYKCIGPDRLCVISDATSGAGMPEGSRFRMGEMEYEVHDGVGMMFDRSCFAGSTTLINDMIPVLIEHVGTPLIEAIRMASLNPARVIGVDDRKGSLEAGKDADIAVFDDDFTAWRTMIGGRWAN